jgi:hypothetical protein
MDGSKQPHHPLKISTRREGQAMSTSMTKHPLGSRETTSFSTARDRLLQAVVIGSLGRFGLSDQLEPEAHKGEQAAGCTQVDRVPEHLRQSFLDHILETELSNRID